MKLRENNFFLEKELQAEGFFLIAGTDEAGRGALAGPLFAATVIMPIDYYSASLNDSKKLSPLTREQLYEDITDKALCYSVEAISAATINERGIAYANQTAMFQATLKVFKSLKEKFNLDLQALISDYVDFSKLLFSQLDLPNFKYIHPKKADSSSLNVAAASILAKVARDRYMLALDNIYPEYSFGKHKGYGTKIHKERLINFGSSPEHRTIFVNTFLKTKGN